MNKLIIALLLILSTAIMGNAKTVTGVYSVGNGDASNGKVISSVDGITMTYGNVDDWTTTSATLSVNGQSFGYYASTTTNNGTNASNPNAANSLSFSPEHDGTLIVVTQNAGNTKSAYIYEDGKSIGATLIGTGGEAVSWAGSAPFNASTNYSGGVQFAVKAGSTYTISLAGSKGRWMGFIYKYEVEDAPVNVQKLNRGLMSLSLSGAKAGSGNLVSWRFRKSDNKNTKFKLYRGDASGQTTALNGGKYILDRTNFVDAAGSASSYYKLEVYDQYGKLAETQDNVSTWSNQTLHIPLEGGAPLDPTSAGATYTPNDASYCDMDGDGEYEIILKWAPSNEKDAASSGTTSPAFYACYKLSGKRLWILHTGHNMFNSAHTTPFIAWDFDGDGLGEFMVKTAPGAIDGNGKYIVLNGDSPTDNLKNGNGKQTSGGEYITVFKGSTGEELATIPYHTDYNAGLSYWGDSNQNRSERYLAALAYLDGEESNPSPIFARGYYSGAFIAAYDWDGTTLRERWVSRNTSSGKGLWGEGAHWICVGDCDEDGKQEIIYGSAALNNDGSLLYRTGLGHGDALHLGDMIPSHPGLEVLMSHEHSPYGIDIRDAKTGTILQRQTEGDDTGRGLAAHFDSTRSDWQFLSSARAQMFNCSDQSVNAESWAIGGSGAGINCRIYWDGDPYDEFFDKSIIAHWNPTSKAFDRFKVNGGNYTAGSLNNYSKLNPCVLGDILGDWREEIVTWTGDATNGYSLIINATNHATDYRIPHLMDDAQYRVQVVNQNCCYNQPPHLSFDPAVLYAGNPSVAEEEDEEKVITKDLFTLDFEDSNNYTNGWVQSANYDANITQIDHNDGKAMALTANLKRGSSLTYSFGNIEKDIIATAYSMDFDFAIAGDGANNNAPTGIKLFVGTTPVFTMLTETTAWSITATMTDGTNTLGTQTVAGKNDASPSPWYHATFTGDETGLYITLVNTNSKEVVLNKVKLSEEPVVITSISCLTGRILGRCFIDDIIFKNTYSIGDVNGDGKINTQDVTALAEILINKSTDKFGTADINDDDTISIMDEVELIKILNQK